MSTVMTLRVGDQAAQHIKKIAQRQKRSLSQIGAQAIEEWTRMESFPAIEFRVLAGERLACLKGRLPVWQVVMVVQDHEGGVASAADHLGLRTEQVQAALDYAAAYPQEIQELLASNAEGLASLQRRLPLLKAYSLPLSQTP
jgi:uncharacterized protein (DUF433 family)